MTMSRQYRVVQFTYGVALIVGVCLLTAAAMSQDSSAVTGRGRDLPGQSSTLLPDGSILLAGGLSASGPTAAAALLTGETVTPLADRLFTARAWHSATVLSSGKVAIIGGVGDAGEVISAVEEFDPKDRSFLSLKVAGLAARSHHTATLLSDGSVLIVGGLSATGKTLSDGQLWDPRTGNIVTLINGLKTPRSDHSATLQPDGTVLIKGGVDSQGNILDDSESYNPKSRVFSLISQVTGSASTQESPVRVTGTIPANGATGVSTATIISLRFSAPIDVRSIDTSTITLTGRSGTVGVQVIAAEDGMLAFVNPDTPLAPSTTYTVAADGLMTRDGTRLPQTSFSFTTGTAGVGAGGGVNPPFPPNWPEGGNSAVTAKVWAPTSDWLTGLPPSPWQSLPPLRASAGVTALSGQVLTIQGLPLAGVTLQVGNRTALTDRSGRFLIRNLSAGKNALLINGATANRGRNTFGLFQVGVAIAARVTTVLSYTIWMPVLDTAHAVTIPSPTTTDTTVSDP
jgi:hypothetical protein